jgi:hypothetical protein
VQVLRFLAVMVMLPSLLRLVYRMTVNPQTDQTSVHPVDERKVTRRKTNVS